MQRRTRRSASTIGGAAPDTIIGRAAADRAGARPYRATRCEKRVEMCHYIRASSPKPFVEKRFFCLPSVDIYETYTDKSILRASYSESCFCWPKGRADSRPRR